MLICTKNTYTIRILINVVPAGNETLVLVNKFLYAFMDRLCGLVFLVTDPEVPGLISRRYQIF
jgi:hypothetical protein